MSIRPIFPMATALVLATVTISSQAPGVGYVLPSTLSHWMSEPADLDGDGAEEIVMTTMDPGMVSTFTPPTQVLVLASVNGVVVDRSATAFGDTPPKAYSSKPVAGDFDGDGQTDLLICDRGRNAGPPPPYGSEGTEGIWRAQNQVWMHRDGKLVNYTDRYPRTIACSWGCSAGDTDGSGKDTIVINAFWLAPNFPAAYLVKWDGSRFVKTLDLTRNPQEWGWTAVADFDRDGKGDVVGGRAKSVLWSGGAGLTRLRAYSQSNVDKLGYNFHRGAVTADFTGDGVPDLVQNTSLSEPTLAESRFALYQFDGRDNLIEKIDAFPDIASYNGNDFGNEMQPIDVDFDGDLDLTTFGSVYGFGIGNRSASAVWMNDGTGRFSRAQLVDDVQSSQACGFYQSYYLKTNDPDTFNVVIGGCGRRYVTRTVTRQRPLRFTR